MNLGLPEIGLIISILAIILTTILSFFTFWNSRKQKKYEVLEAEYKSLVSRYQNLEKKYLSRTSELKSLYEDVNGFITISDTLCKKLGISWQEARKGITISRKCWPSNVKNRIRDLGEQIEKS